ncbi:hypothetical protein AAFF_G00384540 [Aldrovandia affinis]|uniref:DDE Tnp4 domain-containing protein n=1 Tax=Aldrovandia affinis TaxID=143900 RepID=A0AAD7R468_9TELE|nr:hypothetical protein AAFF_G00384540 [Aldrovandia affinis]
MPVLRLYLDEDADLKPDYRLSRASLQHLIGMLRSHQDHGWGHYLEVLVFVFWLASATSYRVVSRSFNIPRTTVHDMVHWVTKKLLKLKNRVIHFPSHTDLENPVRLVVARRFNHHHAKARSIIERSFGIMKTRWRSIFFKSLKVKLTFAPEVIACCTILHNICVSNGDIMEPAEEVFRPDDNADEPHLHQDQQRGEQIREHMAAAVSAPDGPVAALEVHDYL